MMKHAPTTSARRAFTLTELLVAVVVLLVVIAATSKIFGTVSRITSVGVANQDVLTEAAVIQRLIQNDIDRITTDGFLAIRCNEVRNDLYGVDQLLNNALEPDARIRSDQLVFFKDSLGGSQSYDHSIGDDRRKQQATGTMVHIGHGFQIPDGLPVTNTSSSQYRTYDPFGPTGNTAAMIPPWFEGNIDMRRTLFSSISGAGGNEGVNIYTDKTSAGSIFVRPPDARSWVLARQQVLLGDDDNPQIQPHMNGKTFYVQGRSARSVFYQSLRQLGASTSVSTFPSHEIRNGRVDAAATRFKEINDVLDLVANNLSAEPTRIGQWFDQRMFIRNNVLRWPRAERFAPSMHRLDQMLTTSVLGTACSDIRIEWTWAPRTGAFNKPGVPPTLQLQNDAPLYYDRGFAWGPFGGQKSFFNTLGFAANPALESLEAASMPGEYHLDEQPWFGFPNAEFNVNTYNAVWTWVPNVPSWWGDGDAPMPWWRPMPSVTWIDPGDLAQNPAVEELSNVEILFDDPDPAVLPPRPTPTNGEKGYKEYLAVFGGNNNTPVTYDEFGNPMTAVSGDYAWTDQNLLYTPWPDAIRITMTLYDPRTTLRYGREVQFIVPLPRRQ